VCTGQVPLVAELNCSNVALFTDQFYQGGFRNYIGIENN
jgi:hypothetical protein